MLDDQRQDRFARLAGDGHAVEEPITIVMVDDHPMVRRGLRYLLETESDLRVVADVGSHDEAITAVLAHRPAILLLDIELSDGHCFPILDELYSRSCETRAILHSGRLLDAYLWLARSKPNCKAILGKVVDAEEMIGAIRSVASGSEYYDRKVKSRLDRPSPLNLLTPRELEVIVLIAKDYSAKMAGPMLGIKERGVGAHVENIKKKLGLHTNVALANFVHQVGLLQIT